MNQLYQITKKLSNVKINYSIDTIIGGQEYRFEDEILDRLINKLVKVYFMYDDEGRLVVDKRQMKNRLDIIKNMNFNMIILADNMS